MSLDLHRAPWHIAVQGASRSGKSALVYGLLASVALQARQGRMILAGVDPTGTLFSPFRDYPAEHLRASGLRDTGRIVAVVMRLVAEMEVRIETLLSTGRDKLTGGDEVSTILAVFEEYPGLVSHLSEADKAVKPAERVGASVSMGIRRLIQEGAKVGIRVLIIAQRMDASIIGGSELSNIGTRVSLRVDNADAVRMLHEADDELVERITKFLPRQAAIDVTGEPRRFFRSLLTENEAVNGFIGGNRE